MKFLFDYFPIICFFVGYLLWGIYVATAITIAASILQNAAYWLKHRRFEKMHLITMAVIIVLGGLTLIFHNAMFIKWKPSIIYWIFGGVLLGSHYIGEMPLLKRMLYSKIKLPDFVWKKLNAAWAIFFIFLGFLNIYVAYHYDTQTWVYFKLFGTLGLTFLFVFIQALYMARYMVEKPNDQS